MTILAMASKPRGDKSSLRAMKLPAALLMSEVKGPSRKVSSTMASTAAASRMSTPWARTVPPCAFIISSAAASQTPLRRPQMAISAPKPKSRSAMARPSPVPPPVTSAFLPLNRPSWNTGVCLPEPGGRGRPYSAKPAACAEGASLARARKRGAPFLRRIGRPVKPVDKQHLVVGRLAIDLDRLARRHRLETRDHAGQRERGLFERRGERRAEAAHADVGAVLEMLPVRAHGRSYDPLRIEATAGSRDRVAVD